MADLKHQSDLTDGKGWKEVLVEHAKEDYSKGKQKLKNIWGGIKATPKFIKKSFKKD